MKRRVILFFSLLVSVQYFTPALGQKFEISEVTKEDLLNNTYNADTTAVAVILFDIGKIGYRGGTYLPFHFERKRRIKILKKSGLGWGNITFNAPEHTKFKVVVYNYENKMLTSEKATGESSFDQKLKKNRDMQKVFAPNVREGSIIDISYSVSAVPREWRFQDRIPIAYSEMTVDPRAPIAVTFSGYQPVQKVSDNEWHSFDVPAIGIEPFVNNYENYITKLEFENPGFLGLTFNAFTVGNYRNFMKGEGADFLNDFANQINQINLPLSSKIDTSLQYIKSKMKWDHVETIRVSPDLKENFTVTHGGSSADINIILVALLNKLNVKTLPVILSTRENGQVFKDSPTRKFNYVVAYVMENNLKLFLDAASEHSVPGVLSMECLNGQGQIIGSEGEPWVDLNDNRAKQSIKQFANISMDSTGVVKALITMDYSAYGYLNWLEGFDDHNIDGEIRKNILQKENPDLKITSCDLIKVDRKRGTSQEMIALDASNQFIDTGQEFLFNPIFLFEHSKNPFKSTTRKFPVDLIYPKDLNWMIRIQLNGAYSLKQLPESIKYTLPDGSAVFTYQIASTANTIELRVTLKINRPVFTPSEYFDLQNFFSHVAAKVNSSFELTKKLK